MPELDNIKLYQNKGEVANNPTPKGIAGSRQETIALVATRPGTVELPEIRIPWWDKDKHQVQYAVLPAAHLVIHGTPAAESAPPRPAEPAPPPMSVAPAAEAVPPAPTSRPTIWMALTLLLTLAWLSTALLWWRTRGRLAVADQARRPAKAATSMREAEAFNVLRHACQANDPAQARAALLAWAVACWPRARLRILNDIVRLHPNPKLGAICQALDQTLYGHGGLEGGWQGQELLALVKEMRENSGETRTKDEALPPLYR